IALMLAGHTHCGQIVLPVIGAIATACRYRTRYLCGLIQEGGKTLIVTSGIGTSQFPLRIGAPPDMWLITIRSLLGAARHCSGRAVVVEVWWSRFAMQIDGRRAG